MPKPVVNNGISAELGINKGAEGGLGAKLSAKVSTNQGAGVFRQVNRVLGNNPHHNRPNQPNVRTNQPAIKPQQNGQGNNKNNGVNQNQPQGKQAALTNQPANQGNNVGAQTTEQQLEHAQDNQKPIRGNQTNPENTPKTTTPTTPTTPNTPTTPTTNTPPNNLPQVDLPDSPPIIILPTNFPGNIDTSNKHNLPNSLLRLIFGQILQQNDIYLNNPSVNILIDNHSPNYNNSTQSSQNNLPDLVNQLLQNVGKALTNFLNNPANLNGKMIHQIAAEIGQQLHEEIQASKNILLGTNGVDGKHFSQLNIRERMYAAVEMLPRYTPANAMETLQNYTSKEVLDGLLMARGLVAAKENIQNSKNLAVFIGVLSSEISPSALRDVGQLVKILISEAASAKSTANLDLSVQKFVRILLANNELGVLLATISLAGQNQSNSGLIGRSLALAQIYEMITLLILAGEKAMKEAAPENAAKNILQKGEKNSFISLALNAAEKDEAYLNAAKTGGTNAENALRQFLEFNPAFMQDNSTSAFNNSDDAKQAQKDFVTAYQVEIEQWLKSGNHRLVKDIEFEKPLGIVVERDSDGYFSATKARIVLVRDGSVMGWHFLKSFLVT